MQPGISSYCLIGHPLDEALDTLAGITDRIEVMDEGLHFITNPAVFASYTQDFILHAPFHGINIASLFEPIRSASVGVTTDCFRIAAEIGAPVVVHPGYYAWEQEKEEADRQFRISLHELRDIADDLSVTFWFENMGDMNFFNLRTPADLGLLDGTGFTLDTGHANLNRCLPGFLEAGFSHMHIHDNNGRKDTHSTVGAGNIDFAPVMAALRKSKASAVLEVKDFAGVIRSRELLEQL